MTARIPGSKFLIPSGDWNSHVGHACSGFREMPGGKGYGRPEPGIEGERTLEYALHSTCFLGTHVSRNLTASHHIQVRKRSHADRLHPFP